MVEYECWSIFEKVEEHIEQMVEECMQSLEQLKKAILH